MRLLLDTHALIWWLEDSPRLGRRAYEAITEPGNPVLVSAVTAWEIATKYRIGKLPDAAALAVDVAGVIRREGFEEIPRYEPYVDAQHSVCMAKRVVPAERRA